MRFGDVYERMSSSLGYMRAMYVCPRLTNDGKPDGHWVLVLDGSGSKYPSKFGVLYSCSLESPYFNWRKVDEA